jgi:hypothetical protein
LLFSGEALVRLSCIERRNLCVLLRWWERTLRGIGKWRDRGDIDVLRA